MVNAAMGMRVADGGREEMKSTKHTNSYANKKILPRATIFKLFYLPR